VQAQWWIESFVALYHIKRLAEALSWVKTFLLRRDGGCTL